MGRQPKHPQLHRLLWWRSATGIGAASTDLRLRRELVNAKLDLDVVKKAAAYFVGAVVMKYAWIKDHLDQFSVTRMCARLKVSCSGYSQ